jgi:carbon storage regulator
MLVLSRKVDQRVRIGDNIEVVVLAVDGHQVKLGIQAPRDVTILRFELVEDVQEENRRAAAAPATSLPLGSLLKGLAHLRPEPDVKQPAAPNP